MTASFCSGLNVLSIPVCALITDLAELIIHALQTHTEEYAGCVWY